MNERERLITQLLACDDAVVIFLGIEEMPAEVPPWSPNQCMGAVHSPAGSAPERCALPEWHEGKCEP